MRFVPAPAPLRPGSGLPAVALALAGSLLLAPLATAAEPPSAGAEAESPELVDRILAVVNDDPILASDVDRVIALELVEPGREETPEELRVRVLEMLVEERLRFQEIDRFGFADVPLDRVEEGFQQIRDRFASSEAFAARLDALGLDERGLRNLVARQIMVLTFVEERLGPRVFVDLEEIQAYYDDTLVPELASRGERVPPLEEVRESVRRVLREQRLNEELVRWTEELRRRADIEEYIERPPTPPPAEAG